MDERIRSLLARGREHYRAAEYDLAARCFDELAAEGHRSRTSIRCAA